MKAPRFPSGHPDRFLDLQEQIEPAVSSIIATGASAGWSTAELAAAITEVADNLMLADAENRKVDREIRDALRRLRGE